MRSALRSLVLVLFAVVSTGVLAQDASQLFAAGTAAFESGDFATALSRFEQSREAGMQGPAIHYNIASCHYRLGQLEQAERSFEQLARRYPQMKSLADYNLGLVLLRQHREAEASRLFAGVRRDSSDEQLRALASVALSRLDGEDHGPESRPSWIRLVDINIGHDDNVALVDDASVPANQSVDSPFTELVAAISGPLSASPGFRFDGTLYSVRYDDAGSYDQTVVRTGGVYHWRTSLWYVEAGPQLTLSTLDGDSFEQRFGGMAAVRRMLGSSTALGLRVQHDKIRGGQSRFDFLDGQRQQLGLTWDSYAPAGRLTLGYWVEHNDREDANVSPTRNRISIRHRHTGARWETDVQLAFRISSYDDLAVTRDEERVELSLGIARNLPRGWQVRGDYGWFDNDSDVAFYAYTRGRVSLGLTKSF